MSQNTYYHSKREEFWHTEVILDQSKDETHQVRSQICQFHVQYQRVEMAQPLQNFYLKHIVSLKLLQQVYHSTCMTNVLASPAQSRLHSHNFMQSPPGPSCLSGLHGLNPLPQNAHSHLLFEKVKKEYTTTFLLWISLISKARTTWMILTRSAASLGYILAL